MRKYTYYILILGGCLLTPLASAQVIGNQLAKAEEYFYQGSDAYIKGELESALQAVNKGLAVDPSSKKLQDLKKLLEKQKEEEQKQQEQQQQQQQKEQEQQEKEKKEQEEKEQEEKGEQEKKEEEKKEEEQKEQEQQKEEEKKEEKSEEEKKQEEFEKKLEEMNLSEEKARMLLEAMKNSEKQYLQQLKRKATKKNTGKPDW